MNIKIFGSGKMAVLVENKVQSLEHSITNTIEAAAVAIDFSKAQNVIKHLAMCCEAVVPIVIGTTGWDEHLTEAQALVQKHGIGALYAPNFSFGMAKFRALLKLAKKEFLDYDVAGLETHHKTKKDSPSGTALSIARDLKMSTPFSAIRCGSFLGIHEVIFDSPTETIRLTHEVKTRETFALGAIQAAEWIKNKKGWFSLDDMLHSVNYAI